MMIFTLIISVILNVVFLIVCRNLLRQCESWEDNNNRLMTIYYQIQSSLIDVLTRIRTIDIRGAFEADDEVGAVYKEISKTVNSLNQFLTQEQDAEEAKN